MWFGGRISKKDVVDYKKRRSLLRLFCWLNLLVEWAQYTTPLLLLSKWFDFAQLLVFVPVGVDFDIEGDRELRKLSEGFVEAFAKHA